jgi:hypothetical protein
MITSELKEWPNGHIFLARPPHRFAVDRVHQKETTTKKALWHSVHIEFKLKSSNENLCKMWAHITAFENVILKY